MVSIHRDTEVGGLTEALQAPRFAVTSIGVSGTGGAGKTFPVERVGRSPCRIWEKSTIAGSVVGTRSLCRILRRHTAHLKIMRQFLGKSVESPPSSNV
jgi:hypothetical protein